MEGKRERMEERKKERFWEEGRRAEGGGLGVL
jgi:hypothetical protein